MNIKQPKTRLWHKCRCLPHFTYYFLLNIKLLRWKYLCAKKNIEAAQDISAMYSEDPILSKGFVCYKEGILKPGCRSSFFPINKISNYAFDGETGLKTWFDEVFNARPENIWREEINK